MGCELIAVAVPCESRLIATRADDATRVANLVAWSRQMFDGARGRRISPLPFLLRDGAVVGCVNTDDPRFW